MYSPGILLLPFVIATTFLASGAEDCGENKADIVFLIDRSSSIYPNDFQVGLRFLSDITKDFKLSPENVQIGAISFATTARIDFPLGTHTSQIALQPAIGSIRQTGGNTNTAEALRILTDFAMTQKFGARNDAFHMAIVITDGGSDSPVDTAWEALRAQNSGIKLFAIGVGSKVNMTELRLIASDPDATYVFEVPKYEALGQIQELIKKRTCEVMTEAPTTPFFMTPSTTPLVTTEEPTTTRVTTERMVNDATTPRDEYAAACRRKDVVFVPPASAGSVHLSIVLKFIRIITDKLQVDEDSVQVGVVPIVCTSLRGFAMDTHGSNDKLAKALDQPELGLPDTAALLQYARKRSFSFCDGARADARKVAVVIIDYESSNVKNTMTEAAKMKREGVEIFVVAIGSHVNKDEISAVASFKAKYLIKLASYDQILEAASAIISDFAKCPGTCRN